MSKLQNLTYSVSFRTEFSINNSELFREENSTFDIRPNEKLLTMFNSGVMLLVRNLE